jgi:hypothetical protein
MSRSGTLSTDFSNLHAKRLGNRAFTLHHRCMRIGLLALIGLVAGIVVKAVSPIAQNAQVTAPAPATTSQAIGSAGCAAAGCHGAANAESLVKAPTESAWRTAFTHYSAVDPHRKAHDVLKSDLATKMAAHLKAGPNGTVLPAHEDARCLACHVNPSVAVRDPRGLRGEGVSCEACHGDASDWRNAHITWSTAEARKDGMARTGFVDLRDITVRVEVCAGCHVGAPASGHTAVRDMNHDMIAAGHPALDKSIMDLVNRYHAHWYERPRGDLIYPDMRNTAFEEALKRLSRDRRSRHDAHDARTPWPEFADQKCSSCHQRLTYPPK